MKRRTNDPVAGMRRSSPRPRGTASRHRQVRRGGRAGEALGARNSRSSARPRRSSCSPRRRFPPRPARSCWCSSTGGVFLCARPDGDIRPARASGEGLYPRTRGISVGAAAGVRATSHRCCSRYSVDAGHRAVVNATNPDADRMQRVRRCRRRAQHQSHPADRRAPVLHMTPAQLPPAPRSRSASLSLGGRLRRRLRGPRVRDRRRPRPRAGAEGARATRARVRLPRRGREFRETHRRVRPAAGRELTSTASGPCRGWDARARRRARQSLLSSIEPSSGDDRAGAALDARRPRASCRRRRWRAAQLHADRDRQRALRPAHRRVGARPARADDAGRRRASIAAAGIPWYVAPFGRDSLLTALRDADAQPRAGARHAARARRAAGAAPTSPGATRSRARSCTSCAPASSPGPGMIPHTPYYGTVDATPLFLMLAGGYFRWTLDLDTLSALRPALDAALAWIDALRAIATATASSSTSGARRPGCVNQGWKDSHDAVVHADGTPRARGRSRWSRSRATSTRRSCGSPTSTRRSATAERATALRSRGGRAARRVQRGVLGSDEEHVLRARARRRQAAGAQRHLESGALPVLRDRRRRQGGGWSPSA